MAGISRIFSKCYKKRVFPKAPKHFSWRTYIRNTEKFDTFHQLVTSRNLGYFFAVCTNSSMPIFRAKVSARSQSPLLLLRRRRFGRCVFSALCLGIIFDFWENWHTCQHAFFLEISWQALAFILNGQSSGISKRLKKPFLYGYGSPRSLIENFCCSDENRLRRHTAWMRQQLAEEDQSASAKCFWSPHLRFFAKAGFTFLLLGDGGKSYHWISYKAALESGLVHVWCLEGSRGHTKNQNIVIELPIPRNQRMISQLLDFWSSYLVSRI